MNNSLKLILILEVLLGSTVIFAQSPDQYSFIKYNQNRLQLPADSANFIHLFKILADYSSDSGQSVQFIHFGDSHIQADGISNEFRNRISQSFCPDGNLCTQNYIFPHKIAKTNSNPTYTTRYKGDWASLRSTTKQSSYKHQLPLGISGFSVIPKDTLNELLTILDSKQTRGNQLYLFYSRQNQITLPIYLGSDSVLNSQHHPLLGYSIYDFAQISDSIVFQFPTDSFSLQLQGIYLPPLEKQISVTSAGVNGATIGSLRRCEQLLDQIQIIQPHCIILSYGTNDTYIKFDKETFIKDYEFIISSLQTNNPNICIILTTPADFLRNRTSKVGELPELVNSIYEIAQKKQCAVWDLHQIAGGKNAMQKWYISGLASKDKIHFSNKGYKLQGNLLFEAFYQSYLEHKK